MNGATILFLAANPLASGRLALDEEAREIEDRIQPRSCKIPLSLRTRWAVRPDDLLLALNQDRPVVVHSVAMGVALPASYFTMTVDERLWLAAGLSRACFGP